MFNIQIYKAEALDGLSTVIQDTASIACCSPVSVDKDTQENIENKLMDKLNSSYANLNLEILYPTKSVLVTSNWNKNDDVFGVTEAFKARHTPVNQPTNIDHDHHQIVGHITNTWVIDSDGESIDDSVKLEDLPEIIHICNGAVIYKRYKDQDLTDRATNLIAEIEAGTKYVSMECLFPNFDYAVIDADGDNYTVERNESTAFLTKHLRAYGGKGEFNGYRVGRYIRDMIFSGKGYVDKPANPESVIFTDDKPDFSFSDAKHKSRFIFENGVNNVSETFNENIHFVSTSNLNDSKEITMSETNEFYKDELAKAQKATADLTDLVKSLEDKLANANVEQLKSEIEELTKQLEATAKDKEVVATELDESKASFETLDKSFKEVAESKEELEKAIEEIKAAKVYSDRVSVLVEAGVSKEEAESAVSKFINLTDEQFEEISQVYATKAKTEEANVDSVETEEVEASEAEVSEVLENVEVEVETSEDVGSAEADVDDGTTKAREGLTSYFASAFGQSEGSSDNN